MSDAAGGLAALDAEVVSCRACPRLVEWRERVGRERRRAFAGEAYWSRPIPLFGDDPSPVMVLGLAPAAHGGNRTGRVFTGDRSGDFLVAAMHRAGFANQAHSVHRDDGLRLIGCRMTPAVRCAPPANRPLPEERDRCLPYLVREIALTRPRVIVALGAIAWDAALRALTAAGVPAVRPRPRFGHGAEARLGDLLLVGSYHPSQQNTFTGRLTPEMLDAVLVRARAAAQATEANAAG
ncbi:MAG TPA: uracil-DNA glycosylase [Miltoncostaeaceae bacterium]|nr:uracil-DNA glycosylase [Miltoncostaeaceae bacterium]